MPVGLCTQVIPSFEYAVILLPDAIATNLPLPNATLVQVALVGNVLATHVVPPSIEEAATVPPDAMATNIPYVGDTAGLVDPPHAPYATPDHVVLDGSVEYVHDVPPALDADVAVLDATAIKVPLP